MHYGKYATEHIFPGLPTAKMVIELPWLQRKNVWNEVKKSSNHFRKCLADLKSTNKNINSVKGCVLNTSDINQTSLFELKVGCLSRHITLTKESIKS